MADENQDIASPAPAEDEGITAYHGSPYEFERFDTSKIGTGEGAQAYGHGLYLAEHEPVAKEYRDKLSPGSALLDLPPKGDAQRQVLSQLKELGDEGFVYSIDDLKSFVRGSSSYNEPEMMTAFNRLAARAKEKNPGHMYEVKIKANPDHFLDWDKPLRDQSEFVKNALNEFSAEQFGSNIYESSLLVPGKYRDKRAASKALLDRGIVGIKYFDSGSRDEKDGTRNYVVFDDKLLDIKRRYEMGGAVPMASGGKIKNPILREQVFDIAHNVANHALELGYKLGANIDKNHPYSPSQTKIGNSAYIPLFLVRGKKYIAPEIRVSDHSVGPQRFGNYIHILNHEDVSSVKDWLSEAKNALEGESEMPKISMSSGGEAGDTQSMPQLTSEQQSLLDQLSRAIDRVYPAMDAAEARQPVIRHEPTMPGEPALTREQHQEYNIGQLQNALARVPTDYPTGPIGYAEGGDVGDNPAVQKALSLTAGQNQPVLRSTFALENQPSATVSPRPGKGGGPPITHPSENFDPSLITEQKPWTYATPDIIGAPKPPPVQHPVLNEPRMKNIVRRTSKIFGDKNFQKLIKDFTGLEGITATPIVGSWEGEVEPSFVIKHPNMNSEQAKKIAHLLGFGFQQDSVVHTHANPHIDEGIPTVLIGKNQKLSKEEIDQIAHHSINNGLDFSITSDGTAAKYLDFGGPEKHHEFLEKIKKIADATKMNEIYHAFSEGELKNAKDYLTVIFGGAGEEAGLQDRPQRSPDLFRRIVDHVLAPYAKAVASEGYRLSPERLQEAYGLTDDETDYVRSAMRPSGRVDRTTIPLMTKEEKLDIRPTGSRGNPTVEDVLWALQNRAAAKGQIDPEDYSKDAMKKIASDIAKEVDYHVKSSNLGGQKSAIGWYDSALKSAMNVYSSQFPQLAKNKNDRMLFHAILGITSQGNDVYSNSLNAVRVFDLMKNKGLSLSDAVKKLSGTFGDKTKAIEMNLLKFDHLINKNGYDAMRDFFNKKATASEINKILRTNKNLHGPSGSPLDVEGQKDQIVSGWSVFGPKIGSFINNLHGDYSTLTADLWFSRTWNRLLGHGFIHTPLTEAKQYRDLRDAMIAEYNHHNGLPHEQVPYVQNGKIDPNKSWLHGSDLKNISHDDFHDLINDPDRMLEFAKNAFESYKGGSFKEKSDVRRRAKNWIENRELSVAAPRSDLERSFQQNTAEEAKKILKKKYGVDISVADIQAALWFHEKELFDRLGVASKKSKPADYADAAKQTMDLINGGKLYEVKSREKKSQKASGGSVVDQALRLVSKYGSLPGDAVSLSRHLIQRGRP